MNSFKEREDATMSAFGSTLLWYLSGCDKIPYMAIHSVVIVDLHLPETQTSRSRTLMTGEALLSRNKKLITYQR